VSRGDEEIVCVSLPQNSHKSSPLFAGHRSARRTARITQLVSFGQHASADGYALRNPADSSRGSRDPRSASPLTRALEAPAPIVGRGPSRAGRPRTHVLSITCAGRSTGCWKTSHIGKGLAHDGVTYADGPAHLRRRETRDQLEHRGLAAAARPNQR